MIDTHCHLLPGLDDGSRTLDDALELARSMVEAGVEFVLCTPHFSRLYPTNYAKSQKQEAAFLEALASKGLELEIALAAEVGPEFALSADSEQLLARSIARRYLLVELVADTPAVFLETLVERLDELGLLPIIAHPERCRAVQRRIGALDAVCAEGALVQVVAPSLTGRWGKEIAETAWQLVETGRADLIASDAHTRHRRLALLEAAELVSSRLGDHARWELTARRPGLVVRGLVSDEG